jgi:hypothetical protein
MVRRIALELPAIRAISRRFPGIVPNRLPSIDNGDEPS